MENSNLIPHWTDLPEATIAIRDLIKCSCKPEKGCRGRCKCAVTVVVHRTVLLQGRL